MSGQAKLLLVEDSEDDLFFFERTLEKTGMDCKFHRVSNGAAAVDYLKAVAKKKSVPPVMFLDLKMPVLNGFEVLDWLRTQPFARQIRVIVLSGSEHHADKERATRLGAADYVVKPVGVEDLQRFLRKLCRSKREIGAHV